MSIENNEIISMQNMTAEALGSVFDRAFIKAHIDEDNDVVVEMDGYRVFVVVDDDRTLLRYSMTCGFREESNMSERLTLANKINDKLVFARFYVSVSHPVVLFSDYYQHFEAGLSPHQIVASIRYFANIVPKAIRLCDEDDIIE